MKMALFDAYFLNAFLSLFSERMVKMGWNFTQTPPTFSSFGGKRCSKIRREWCTIEAKRYCSEMRCIYLKRCHFFILKSSWNLKRGVYFTILDIYTSHYNFCLNSPPSNLKMLTTAEIETLRTISLETNQFSRYIDFTFYAMIRFGIYTLLLWMPLFSILLL